MPDRNKERCKNPSLYGRWAGIKSRCYNPKRKCYNRYGGRGITMCEEWRNSYAKFRDWALSNGYSEELQIDRRDNDGLYSPENCRWITQAENCRNKSKRFERVDRTLCTCGIQPHTPSCGLYEWRRVLLESIGKST